MTDTEKNAFRKFLSRLSWKFVLLEWTSVLLLVILGIAWLQLPDSHLWQFVLSILLAVVLVAAALSFLAESFRRLRKPESSSPLWLRAIWILLFVAIWWLLHKPFDIGRAHEALFAGYWNSKLSPHMRVLFSFPRLVNLQEYFYSFLGWLIDVLLLPLAIEAGGVRLRADMGKNVLRVYRQWMYWVAAFIAMAAGMKITGWLVNWMPGKGVAAETMSVLSRLSIAYTIDILFWCFVLALVTEYLSASDAQR